MLPYNSSDCIWKEPHNWNYESKSGRFLKEGKTKKTGFLRWFCQHSNQIFFSLTDKISIFTNATECKNGLIQIMESESFDFFNYYKKVI